MPFDVHIWGSVVGRPTHQVVLVRISSGSSNMGHYLPGMQPGWCYCWDIEGRSVRNKVKGCLKLARYLTFIRLSKLISRSPLKLKIEKLLNPMVAEDDFVYLCSQHKFMYSFAVPGFAPVWYLVKSYRISHVYPFSLPFSESTVYVLWIFVITLFMLAKCPKWQCVSSQSVHDIVCSDCP